MIPPTLPHITSSNWRQMHDQGWRYVRLLPPHREQSDQIIKKLQAKYGVARVTIGQAWDHDRHGPVATDQQAVYVKDIDSLVEAIYDDIEEFEKTGKI